MMAHRGRANDSAHAEQPDYSKEQGMRQALSELIADVPASHFSVRHPPSDWPDVPPFFMHEVQAS
jgi:hypothetical protein